MSCTRPVALETCQPSLKLELEGRAARLVDVDSLQACGRMPLWHRKEGNLRYVCDFSKLIGSVRKLAGRERMYSRECLLSLLSLLVLLVLVLALAARCCASYASSYEKNLFLGNGRALSDDQLCTLSSRCHRRRG